MTCIAGGWDQSNMSLSQYIFFKKLLSWSFVKSYGMLLLVIKIAFVPMKSINLI
jgi:hypothetical protein